MDMKSIIRQIPDFPKPGINFIDVTTLMQNPPAFKNTITELSKLADSHVISAIAGIESRGFIFGAPVAIELGVGFIPLRKPGKLPAETISESYLLEYGSDTIEMHRDAVNPGDSVMLIDDLLATGGTMAAAVKLLEKAGAEVEKIACVVELGFLQGRENIQGYDFSSLVVY